jgi:hypothetical protein
MSRVEQAIEESILQDRIVHVDVSDEEMDELSAESDAEVENGSETEYWGKDEEGNTWRVHATRLKPEEKEFVRYRIDASREINGVLHSASEAVEEEWHDTEEAAVAYAEDLIEEDEELILTVGEYAIESAEEPTDYDWAGLSQRAPRREVSVGVDA